MSTTLVPVDRIRNGQPAAAEIVTSFTDTGDGLPVLTICSGWRPRLNSWRAEDTYRVEEVPTPLGRGFVLHRSEEAIARDPAGPDAETFYAVLIGNPQDHTCTCRGHQTHGRCKHHDALVGLLAGGHIDHPEAGRPSAAQPEAQPTPADLDPSLCPECGGELVVIEDDGRIVCVDCPASYRLADDVTEPGYLLDSDLELMEPDPDAETGGHAEADATLAVVPF